MLFAPDINPSALSINPDKSFPKSVNKAPLFIIDTIPAIKSAAQSFNIPEVNEFIPVTNFSSMPLTPVINPPILSMKSDKFAPIAGKPEVAPSPKPLIILPTNLPIARPTIARVSPPEETNSLNPGILENAPNAVSTPVITATKPAKPIAP